MDLPLPLPPPERARAMIAIVREVERPHKMDVIMVTERQIRMMYLRPK